MEEQGVGSRQILEGMSNVNEITRQVISDSRQMLEGSRAVNQVNDLSGKHREGINVLIKEVSRFKV